MTAVTFATPFRTAPRALQYLAPSRPSIDGAGAALSEAEASEFTVRLIDARSEAEFDHLLGAILTHAALRAGGSLPTALGSALGGLLKSIARQGLSRRAPAQALGLELEGLDGIELEFEAALRFVRLAAEAARHAAEEPVIAPSRNGAQAAMAAASDIYAPPLLSAFAPHDRPFGEGIRRSHLIKLDATGRPALQPRPFRVWVEPFQYDPEMEYFLGDIVKSIGHVARDVGRTIGKVTHDVGKIPIVGDVARAAMAAGGPVTFAIDAGSRLARGENLGNALKGAVDDQIAAARSQLKLANMVAPFVPGIGTGVAAALGAANALAEGRPITEAVLAAARSALPGGAIAQAAFDVATNLAQGKNFGEAALAAVRDQIPGGAVAQTAFDTALNLTKGKSIGDAALAAVRDHIPGGAVAQAAFDTALNFTKGKNISDAALAAVRNQIPGGAAARAAFDGAVALSKSKNIGDAALAVVRDQIPGGAAARAAFDKAVALSKSKDVGHAALAAVRDQIPGGPAARAAFDGAVALSKAKQLQKAAAAAGKIHRPSPYAANPVSFIKAVTKGQNVQNAALSVVGQRALRQVRANAALAANLPKRAWPRGDWRGLPKIAQQRR